MNCNKCNGEKEIPYEGTYITCPDCIKTAELTSKDSKQRALSILDNLIKRTEAGEFDKFKQQANDIESLSMELYYTSDLGEGIDHNVFTSIYESGYTTSHVEIKELKRCVNALEGTMVDFMENNRKDLKKIKELEQYIDNLKCCGNCVTGKYKFKWDKSGRVLNGFCNNCKRHDKIWTGDNWKLKGDQNE